MCVYPYREPREPGVGLVQTQCFHLYWMTNQPYVTGQELTGNQCIQPPILHQYSLTFWLIMLLLPSSSSSSLKLGFCSVLLWKLQHLYFKDVFVSLLCIQMIRLPLRTIRREPSFRLRLLLPRCVWGDDGPKRNASLRTRSGPCLTFDPYLLSLSPEKF